MAKIITFDPEGDDAEDPGSPQGIIRYYEYIKGDTYPEDRYRFMTTRQMRKRIQELLQKQTETPEGNTTEEEILIYINNHFYKYCIMARIRKNGLDYFPLDANFLTERDIRRLVRKYGNAAPIVILAILSLVYKENGYYLIWNEDVAFDISELACTDIDTVRKILEDAITMKMFHQKQFEENGALTSVQIQEQYIMSTAKRKNVEIVEKYRLITLPEEKKEKEKKPKKGEPKSTPEGTLSDTKYTSGDINTPQTTIWGEETTPNSALMPHSIVKHSIVEHNKENNTPPSPTGMKGVEGGLENEEFVEMLGYKVPAYSLNKRTHNCDGMIERLRTIRVTDPKELAEILKKGDYGRIGSPVWGIIGHAAWPKGNAIKMPGKFILAQIKKIVN